MNDNSLIFDRFPTVIEANNLQSFLEEHGINTWVVDNSPPVDVALGGTHIDDEFLVKINAEDWTSAKKVIEENAGLQLSDLPEDYYLYDFSDEELLKLLFNYDEWGELDQVLARQLLNERGVTLSDSDIENMKKDRLEVLSKPERPSLIMLIWGYIAAVGGGIFGFVIGWTLISKKTLPDGRKVPNYNEKGIKHGLNMLYISSVTIVIATFLFFLKEWVKSLIHTIY